MDEKEQLTEQERLQLCSNELQGVLVKYGCTIQATPRITPEGRIVVDVQIILAR